jgi:uncharacterized protein (DUF2062 family)
MIQKIKQILTDKRCWAGAVALFWWIDFQTLWAPSLYKALVISFNHLFVLMLMTGIIVWVIIDINADRRRRDLSTRHRKEDQ